MMLPKHYIMLSSYLCDFFSDQLCGIINFNICSCYILTLNNIFKKTFNFKFVIKFFEHVILSLVQENSQEFTVQHSSCVHFTLGDEPRRMCCSNTRSTMLNWLVYDRKFTKIVTNHLRLHEKERDGERERERERIYRGREGGHDDIEVAEK